MFAVLANWGLLYFTPDAEPGVTDLVKRFVNRGPRSIPGARVLCSAGKDGTVWRVPDGLSLTKPAPLPQSGIINP